MYCSRCGREIPDDSAFCPECGNPTNSNYSQQINYSQNQSDYSQNQSSYSDKNVQDDPNTIANIASCCFPIVGLVLYLVWKDSKPKSASAVCKWAIGGLVAGVIIYILAAAVGAATAFSGF